MLRSIVSLSGGSGLGLAGPLRVQVRAAGHGRLAGSGAATGALVEAAAATVALLADVDRRGCEELLRVHLELLARPADEPLGGRQHPLAELLGQAVRERYFQAQHLRFELTS